MLHKFINAKWQAFYNNMQKWVTEHHQAQFIKAGNKHEQYVNILQKRYGYTKEKAAYELKRRYSKVRFC